MTDTTHEAPELLPCPFCGEQAEVEQQGTARQSHIIACTCCGCRCESGETGDMRGNRWNTRADRIEALTAERDALAEKLAKAVEDLKTAKGFHQVTHIHAALEATLAAITETPHD